MNTRKRSGQSIALALSWDGARLPASTLPPKARAFLAVGVAPSSKSAAKLFSDDQIREIRICWVPQLEGGLNVLSEVFPTSTKKRLPFKSTRITRIGDILGVVYRRLSA